MASLTVAAAPARLSRFWRVNVNPAARCRLNFAFGVNPERRCRWPLLGKLCPACS
jgi:hypothetical protein